MSSLATEASKNFIDLECAICWITMLDQSHMLTEEEKHAADHRWRGVKILDRIRFACCDEHADALVAQAEKVPEFKGATIARWCVWNSGVVPEHLSMAKPSAER